MASNAKPLLIDNQTLSDLLCALYGSAISSELGEKKFLTMLKNRLNLQHASLIVRPPSATDPGLIYTSGDDSDIATFDTEEGTYANIFAHDPLINLPLRTVITLDDVMPRQQLMESDLYQLFMKPLNIYYAAGIDWLYDAESRISIRFTREKSQGDFTQEEKEFFKLLIPHLEQSVSIGLQLRQLDTERQIYAESIAKRSIGIVTLDKQGNVLQSNATAKNYLTMADGIQVVQKSIRLTNSALNDKFAGFIQEALDAIKSNERAPINALSVPRESGKTPYQVLIKPMPVQPHDASDITPYLTVFIQDPEKNLEISVRTLMNLYQLTMSEATIAILLAEGHTTDEVAEELNIKKNTVRAHLRAMFVKMGVTQQSMLVSLVLTSLASTQ